MKIKGLITFYALLFVISGCQENGDSAESTPVSGDWNLVNVSGGFAGINENFEKGSIVWTFDADQGTLEVANNNSSNALYDGLPSGNYTYDTMEEEGNLFLFIDNIESGGVTISKDEMVLNQNMLMNGSGADRYVLKLNK